MKKVICLALFALLFGACEEQDSIQAQQVTVQDTVQPTPKPTRIVGQKYSFGNTNVDIRLIIIDGHEYIVAATTSSTRPGGVSIIHSESCKCHKIQYNKENHETVSF